VSAAENRKSSQSRHESSSETPDLNGLRYLNRRIAVTGRMVAPLLSAIQSTN